MTGSRTRNSARNIVCGSLDKTTAIIFPFIVRTIFIKVLGEEYLGLGSLYQSILQVINLVDLGFSSAISAALYRPIAEDNHEQIGMLLNLYDKLYRVLGLMILAIGIMVTPFLEYFIDGKQPAGINIHVLWLIYLTQAALGYLVFAYRVTLLSAIQRSDIASLIAAAVRTTISLVQIILVIRLHDMVIYATLNALYTLMYNLICAYVCKRKYPQYRKSGNVDKRAKKQISRNVIAFALQKIGNKLSISLDSIVISSFLGLSMVAIYSNYYYVISAIASFIALVVSSITASIGNSMATESMEKNYGDFIKIFMLHTWVVGWCCICFAVLFQDFMRLWMGEKLMLPFAVVIALIARFYFEQIRKVVLNYKDAVGLWTQDRWRPIAGCAVNIVLNIITVKHYGVIGVAVSTIIDFAVVEMPWETMTLFKYCFRTSARLYYKELLKSFLFTVSNGIITLMICFWMPVKGIPALVVKGCMCLVLPNLLYILEMKKDSNFIYAMDLLKKAFRVYIK
nr:oligosaccharide flippase family protein [uncultured Acetatifactor sp.]